MEDNIVEEKIFKEDRWYVRLSNGINGKKLMPNANYVWIKGNPGFQTIPKGYVVHHLDHDKTNDDVSNLVIMQKHHHIAHHWKNKTISPDVRVEFEAIKRSAFFPIHEPRVCFNKDRNVWCLKFSENINGERKRKFVCNMDGIRFDTEKKAEEAKAKIWP